MVPFGNSYRPVYVILSVALLLSFLASMKWGAIIISWDDILIALRNPESSLDLTQRIFLDIRLPRAITGIVAGAALAVSGVLMQALFRNPIVEPGLIGTSSGAAFGAALYFVLGSTFHFHAGEWTLPIAAALGGTMSTMLVYLLARTRGEGRSTAVTLLLTGIAVNALFLSGVGFMSYLARDPQARSITFWNLGNLSGANWNSVIVMTAVLVAGLILAVRHTRHLNALMMGEEEAMLLGVNIRRLQIVILSLNVILVAAVVSFTGIISFVGLVVPHLLRLIRGSDNRYLLIGSAMLGGILLSLADLVARLALAPAELPIGIVTSIVGVPVFIFLLRKHQYYF